MNNTNIKNNNWLFLLLIVFILFLFICFCNKSNIREYMTNILDNENNDEYNNDNENECYDCVDRHECMSSCKRKDNCTHIIVDKKTGKCCLEYRPNKENVENNENITNKEPMYDDNFIEEKNILSDDIDNMIDDEYSEMKICKCPIESKKNNGKNNKNMMGDEIMLDKIDENDETYNNDTMLDENNTIEDNEFESTVNTKNKSKCIVSEQEIEKSISHLAKKLQYIRQNKKKNKYINNKCLSNCVNECSSDECMY